MTLHLPTDELDRNYEPWILSETALDGALIIFGIVLGLGHIAFDGVLLWAASIVLTMAVLYFRMTHRESQVPRVR